MVPMARISGKSMVIINKFSNGFLCKITKKIPKSGPCTPICSICYCRPLALAQAGFSPANPICKIFLTSSKSIWPQDFPKLNSSRDTTSYATLQLLLVIADRPGTTVRPGVADRFPHMRFFLSKVRPAICIIFSCKVGADRFDNIKKI